MQEIRFGFRPVQPGRSFLRLHQAQIASKYAYTKEIRNIVWLAEMISRRLAKNHQGWRKIIIPFSHLQWLKYDQWT